MNSSDGATPRRHRSPSLRLLYLVIGGTGLAAAIATLLYPDVTWLREFGPNVATESLALVVTLAVVRRILDRQERNRRLRASVGALRKAARSLRAMAEGWSELVKGSLPRVPAERPTTYDELLASHYTEALTWLDPRNPGGSAPQAGGDDAGSDAGTDRRAEIRRRIRRVAESRVALAALSQSYAVVLDGDYVEALEALVDDRFALLVAELMDDGADAVTWRRRLNLARGPRESCFRALLLAIRIHNRLAGEAATQRSEHLLPRGDVLDVALPVEDDLIVDPTLDAGFWTDAPLPGALRTREPAGSPGTRRERRA